MPHKWHGRRPGLLTALITGVLPTTADAAGDDSLSYAAPADTSVL